MGRRAFRSGQDGGRGSLRPWALRGAGAGIAALVALGLAPGVAAAAPGDAEIAEAQAAQDAAAAQVGAISAQLAQAEAAAAAAHQAAQIALQEYEERRAAQQAAQAAADAAAAEAEQAAQDLARGRAQVVEFARDSYMQGSTSPGAAALMSADGPAQLLERVALLEAAGTHRVDVVAELTVLEEQAAAADAAARQAVGEATARETEAAGALAAAQQQEISARGQAASLAQQRTAWEAELVAAQQTLYGLQGAQAAAQTAAQAAAAQAAAAARPPAPAATVGSSSGGGTASRPAGGGATTAGAPSGSVVERAIAAARTQMGMPYSWGGGGTNGPGYGLDPDTEVYGFDCSGLTEYAYARVGIAIGGTSREQYSRFQGSTVAASDLRAGDLVFWANGPSISSIYHVALYLGNGQVIQAPQSGDVVRVSSMWFGSDYFGAVRPTG